MRGARNGTFVDVPPGAYRWTAVFTMYSCTECAEPLQVRVPFNAVAKLR